MSVFLEQSHNVTEHLLGGIAPQHLFGKRLRIVNPPLWEFTHVAWFLEYWCLRRRSGGSYAESIIDDADARYNSAILPHARRWDTALLDWNAARRYRDEVFERVQERLANDGTPSWVDYFVELAAYHQDMHNEAFCYSRQTLGYPAPFPAGETQATDGDLAGDVAVPGGDFELGAAPDTANFVFDNEKWAHRVRVEAFRIARAPVTQARFSEFVDDDGYRRDELWCDAGRRWRERSGRTAPAYWRRLDGAWQQRVFEVWLPLASHTPMLHVNAYEAEAWCRWAGRRLPTEAEWELAASTDPARPGTKRHYPWGDGIPVPCPAQLDARAHAPVAVNRHAAGDSAWGCRQMLGNVWEWTASSFTPYPGFTIDPYKEYSQPWFGDHRVLRGGSFATPLRLLRNTWRNFYTPDRYDVFAGFRTCALD